MQFIPVKTFDSYVTANIWMGRLEEENIVCFLQDEYSVTINPALANAAGGIKLCVTSAQLERCKKLILKMESETAIKCPDCDSLNIHLEEKANVSGGFLKKLVKELFSFRHNSIPQAFHCRNCNSWYDELPSPLSLQQAICSKTL